MRQEVEYAELHTPLFLAGTNLGSKLNTRDLKRSNLGLVFDYEKRRLMVSYNGKVANIPEANVASFVESDPNGPEKIIPVKPVAPIKPITAQASSPTDHVFAGPGAGKTK